MNTVLQRSADADGNNTLLRRVDNMISIMEQFCTILKKENAALSDYKIRDIERLVGAKDRIVNVYAEQYQFFCANPEALQAIDEPRKKAVRDASLALQEMMRRNEELLRVNIDTSRRVLQMISEAVQKQESEEMGVYSSTGSLGKDKRSNITMSFNEVL